MCLGWCTDVSPPAHGSRMSPFDSGNWTLSVHYPRQPAHDAELHSTGPRAPCSPLLHPEGFQVTAGLFVLFFSLFLSFLFFYSPHFLLVRTAKEATRGRETAPAGEEKAAEVCRSPALQTQERPALSLTRAVCLCATRTSNAGEGTQSLNLHVDECAW